MITTTSGKCASMWPCDTIDCTTDDECIKHKDSLNPWGNTCLRSIRI